MSRRSARRPGCSSLLGESVLGDTGDALLWVVAAQDPAQLVSFVVELLGGLPGTPLEAFGELVDLRAKVTRRRGVRPLRRRPVLVRLDAEAGRDLLDAPHSAGVLAGRDGRERELPSHLVREMRPRRCEDDFDPAVVLGS